MAVINMSADDKRVVNELFTWLSRIVIGAMSAVTLMFINQFRTDFEVMKTEIARDKVEHAKQDIYNSQFTQNADDFEKRLTRLEHAEN